MTRKRSHFSDKLARDALHGAHWTAHRVGDGRSKFKVGDSVRVNRTKEESVIIGINEIGDYLLEGYDPKYGFPASALQKL